LAILENSTKKPHANYYIGADIHAQAAEDEDEEALQAELQQLWG